MKIFKLTILSFALLMTSASFGQTKIDPTLEVKRDFDGKIQEFSKSKLNTQIPDSVRSFNNNMEYSIFNKPIKDLYEFSPLPSAQLVSTVGKKFPFFYSKFGIGMPAAPEFELRVQPNVGQKSSFLLNFDHNSFLGDLPLTVVSGNSLKSSDFKANAQNMKNNLGIKFGQYWSKGQVTLNLDYKKDFYTYYGVNQTLVEDFRLINGESDFDINKLSDQKFMRDSLSHTYEKVSALINLKSTNPNKDAFYYNLIAGISLLRDKPSLFKDLNALPFNEKYINVSFLMGPAFTGHHKFQLGVNYQGASTIHTNIFDRGNIEIFPVYKFEYKILKLDASFKYNHYFSNEIDTARSNVYLKANIQAEVVKNYLWMFARVDGGNIFHTYQKQIVSNPWLNPNVQLFSTNIPYSFQIGLTGQFNHRFTYSIYGGYTKLEKSPFYYHSSDVREWYDSDSNPYPNPRHNLLKIGYSDYSKVNFTGDFNWKSEDFYSGLNVSINSFKTEDDSNVYDQAPVEIEGFARYNFRERIIVGAELQVKGKRYVKFDTEDLTLPAFSKINLDATYVYDKNLSFYLKLNNLLNTKEYTYLFYKQIGINLGVGISLKF